MKNKAHWLVNFALFQAAWFACVLGGANDVPLVGTLAVGLAVAVHLTFCEDPVSELRLVGVVALLGVTWDSIIVSSGLMSYPSGNFLPGVAPHWIIAMWINFAVTLNVSMSWLKNRPLVAALLGGFGGPLAYLTGFKLGGVMIPELWLGLGVQGVGWAIIMPLLTLLADKFDGVCRTVEIYPLSSAGGAPSRV